MHRLMFVTMLFAAHGTAHGAGDPPRTAAPSEYTVVPARSHLVGRLFRAGIGARLAHDHVIEARKLTGSIHLDPAHPERTRISITVDTRSLLPDGAKIRRLYRMAPLSSDDMAKILRNMQAADQLFVGRFPAIRFRSTQVKPLGQDRFQVQGTLELRGVKRKVTLQVQAHLAHGTLKGKGQLRFKQSAFGYSPYSAALGMLKVRDQALVDIYLEARPTK